MINNMVRGSYENVSTLGETTAAGASQIEIGTKDE